jgi:HD-GYP domain-containing protein (c-di-GMP phosphodiesterase class II)
MRYVALRQLTKGMILAKPLYNQMGNTLLREGSPITDNIIKKLESMNYPGLYINDALSEGIEVKDVISDDIRRNASLAVGRLLNNLEMGNTATIEQELSQIKGLLNQIIEEVMSDPSAIVNLIDLKEFDSYTHQHSVNVCVLSCIIGAMHRLSPEEMYDLALAGILHDIGKIYIDKKILHKPDKLDPEEFEIIKTHSSRGSDLIFDKCHFSPSVSTSILHHHERFDGNGYPLKKKADEIILYAQIISIADVYDALTSKRPYREPSLPSEAYEYVMGNSGQAFNPAFVDIFVRKIAPYPVGMQVVLSNGWTGIVFKNNEHNLMRPVIRLELLPGQSNPINIDLNDAASNSITIQKVLI